MVDVPGQRGRELRWAEGVEQIMVQAAQLAARAGATEVEFGHEVLDRTVLGPRQEPRKTDRVKWFFTGRRYVKIRGRRPIPVEVTGEHIVEPGGDHAVGCAHAAVDFLEKLGVNVAVVDMTGLT